MRTSGRQNQITTFDFQFHFEFAMRTMDRQSRKSKTKLKIECCLWNSVLVARNALVSGL